MTFLVVLGCHRSGTSALTGLISTLGFHPGKSLMRPTPFNELGYFEDITVAAHNDALLQTMGRSWKDERQLPMGWVEKFFGLTGGASLSETLRSGFDITGPCILKDPRICRLLPAFDNAFGLLGIAPKYIFSLRSPNAVVASLCRRDNIAPARAALVYVAYLLEAERETRGKNRIFVKYENLLTNWRPVINEVAEQLKIPELLPSALSDEVRVRADRFLLPGLDHSPAHDVCDPESRPMKLASAIHECLCSLEDDHTRMRMDALYAEWVNYLELLEPWLSEAVEHERWKDSLPNLLQRGSEALDLLSVRLAPSCMHWASAKARHCEENTRRLTWHFGPPNKHRFVLPTIAEPITELRWDVTECPAYCKVTSLWIESPDGKTVWSWDKKHALLLNPSRDLGLIGTNDEGDFEFISLGSDPFGVIHLPGNVLVQLQEGWAVCAEWTASLPAEGIQPMLGLMNKSLSLLQQTQRKLQSTEKSMLAHQQSSINAAKSLQELQLQSEKFRFEISRAEAQFGILKELILDSNDRESII